MASKEFGGAVKDEVRHRQSDREQDGGRQTPFQVGSRQAEVSRGSRLPCMLHVLWDFTYGI